jgi:hypothetical protein
MLKNEAAIFNSKLPSLLKYAQNTKGMNITSYQSNLHAFCVFNCDRDRVRTCNPQSRNLIFYPVELRSR